MIRFRTILIALIAASVLPSTARAQQAPAPAQGDAQSRPPDINMLLTEPFRGIDNDSFKREDLRDVPPPKRDRLSESVRVTVTVGDPRCAPGEDLWEFSRPPSRPFRPIR
jgi:hypothetical protein